MPHYLLQEHDTAKVAQEGILMSLYAWNSAPLIGTDISRSMIVVGRNFQFPIDYCVKSHHMLTANPKKMASYADEQASLLACGCDIALKLIHHQCDYHHDYINARRPK